MNTLSIFRRTVIGMLGLTLAMTSVVLIAPSASAATYQVPTWIKLQTIAPTPVGGTQQIQGQVIGTLGGDQGYVDVGTVTVLRQLSGEPGMTTIGSTPVGSTFSLSVPAVRNATYQVVYSGGTESSFGNLYKYSPSSTVAQGPVTRAVGLRFPARFRGSARIRIAVSPSYAKRFVTVQKDPVALLLGALQAGSRPTSSALRSRSYECLEGRSASTSWCPGMPTTPRAPTLCAAGAPEDQRPLSAIGWTCAASATARPA